MTTEDILVRVREDGSRVVSRNIEGIGKSSDMAAGAVDRLKKAALALGAFFATDKLMQWADTWGTAAGTIRIATNNLEEATAVQNELFALAQRTRSEYGSVVELFGRASLATKDLGASQRQVLQFSEGVGKALAIQGTNATQASGALIQLSQILGSGKVEMADYRSLIDSAPVVLQTVAANIEETGGSVARLTQLVRDGRVSSKEFFDAFLAGSESLDEKFQQTSTLFSQAWVVFSNGMSRYVGQLNESLGLSDKFTAFAQWLSDNLPNIVKLLLSVGAAMLVAFAPAILTSFAAGIAAIGMQIQILFWRIAANPIGALLTALAAVLTALYLFRDEIKLGIDEHTTLGDVGRAAWEDISYGIETVTTDVGTFFANLLTESTTAHEGMTKNAQTTVENSEAWWLKLLRWVAQVFDMIGGVIRGAMVAAYATIAKAVELMMGAFTNLGDALQAALAGDGAGITAAIQKQFDSVKDLGSVLGDTFSQAFMEETLKQQDSGLESVLNAWIARAQEMSKLRAAAAGGGIAPDAPGTTPPAVVDPNAAKRLEQLNRELNSLIGSIDPVQAALMQLAEAQSIFNEAVNAGLITQAEASMYMDRLAESLQAQLDPWGAMNDEIDRQQELLKLSNAEAMIESELFDRINDLKASGVDVTKEMTDALRAELVVTQELTRIAQARDMMRESSGAGRLKTFMAEVEAMKQLLALGREAGGLDSGDAAGALEQMLPWANLDGTREQMAAYVQAHADMYTQIKALEDKSVIDSRTANMLRAQADSIYNEQRLAQQRQFFGTLAQLSGSSNKKLAAIGKAAAVTQAVIDGVSAVQKALASSAPPYNFIMAAAVGAVAAANVASIISQPLPGYRTGGEFMVGGGGVSDSQTVAFRATPGERVTVTPPGQQGPQQGAQAAPAPTPVQVAIVDNPERALSLFAGEQGDAIFIDLAQRNPDVIRGLVGA